jgi:SAM-dependent methyltransferase
MNASLPVFDRSLVRQRRNRAAAMDGDYTFLSDWAIKDLAGRLSMVRRQFPTAVQIGSRSLMPDPKAAGIETMLHLDLAEGFLKGRPNAIRADEEFLPLAHGTIDLIISLLNLHTVNDLPGTLIQIRRALKADGLFIAAMLGGETLYQLRDVLSQAELDISSGLSPRVAPFADKQQMGALMQRAGFALPVVDSELLTVTYENLPRLFEDLRGMGETASMEARSRAIPSRRLFERAAELYAKQYPAEKGRIEVTFEVIFLTGWAPHENQQKPLRPGSADHSLAEILGSEEKSC